MYCHSPGGGTAAALIQCLRLNSICVYCIFSAAGRNDVTFQRRCDDVTRCRPAGCRTVPGDGESDRGASCCTGRPVPAALVAQTGDGEATAPGRRAHPAPLAQSRFDVGSDERPAAPAARLDRRRRSAERGGHRPSRGRVAVYEIRTLTTVRRVDRLLI